MPVGQVEREVLGERGAAVLADRVPDDPGLVCGVYPEAGRGNRRRAIRDAVSREIERWLEPAAADATSAHVVAVMQGSAVQARDGSTSEESERVVGEVVAGNQARRMNGSDR